MVKVEIYTTMFCGYCSRAKKLLDQKGVAYEEIDILENTARRDEMISRSDGKRTVPQIFIDGKAIGGSQELYELDRRGGLDPLLAGGAAARSPNPPAE